MSPEKQSFPEARFQDSILPFHLTRQIGANVNLYKEQRLP